MDVYLVGSKGEFSTLTSEEDDHLCWESRKSACRGRENFFFGRPARLYVEHVSFSILYVYIIIERYGSQNVLSILRHLHHHASQSSSHKARPGLEVPEAGSSGTVK